MPRFSIPKTICEYNADLETLYKSGMFCHTLPILQFHPDKQSVFFENVKSTRPDLFSSGEDHDALERKIWFLQKNGTIIECELLAKAVYTTDETKIKYCIYVHENKSTILVDEDMLVIPFEKELFVCSEVILTTESLNGHILNMYPHEEYPTLMVCDFIHLSITSARISSKAMKPFIIRRVPMNVLIPLGDDELFKSKYSFAEGYGVTIHSTIQKYFFENVSQSNANQKIFSWITDDNNARVTKVNNEQRCLQLMLSGGQEIVIPTVYVFPVPKTKYPDRKQILFRESPSHFFDGYVPPEALTEYIDGRKQFLEIFHIAYQKSNIRMDGIEQLVADENHKPQDWSFFQILTDVKTQTNIMDGFCKRDINEYGFGVSHRKYQKPESCLMHFCDLYDHRRTIKWDNFSQSDMNMSVTKCREKHYNHLSTNLYVLLRSLNKYKTVLSAGVPDKSLFLHFLFIENIRACVNGDITSIKFKRSADRFGNPKLQQLWELFRDVNCDDFTTKYNVSDADVEVLKTLFDITSKNAFLYGADTNPVRKKRLEHLNSPLLLKLYAFIRDKSILFLDGDAKYIYNGKHGMLNERNVDVKSIVHYVFLRNNLQVYNLMVSEAVIDAALQPKNDTQDDSITSSSSKDLDVHAVPATSVMDSTEINTDIQSQSIPAANVTVVWMKSKNDEGVTTTQTGREPQPESQSNSQPESQPNSQPQSKPQSQPKSIDSRNETQTIQTSSQSTVDEEDVELPYVMAEKMPTNHNQPSRKRNESFLHFFQRESNELNQMTDQLFSFYHSLSVSSRDNRAKSLAYIISLERQLNKQKHYFLSVKQDMAKLQNRNNLLNGTVHELRETLKKQSFPKVQQNTMLMKKTADLEQRVKSLKRERKTLMNEVAFLKFKLVKSQNAISSDEEYDDESSVGDDDFSTIDTSESEEPQQTPTTTTTTAKRKYSKNKSEGGSSQLQKTVVSHKNKPKKKKMRRNTIWQKNKRDHLKCALWDSYFGMKVFGNKYSLTGTANYYEVPRRTLRRYMAAERGDVYFVKKRELHLSKNEIPKPCRARNEEHKQYQMFKQARRSVAMKKNKTI